MIDSRDRVAQFRLEARFSSGWIFHRILSTIKLANVRQIESYSLRKVVARYAYPNDRETHRGRWFFIVSGKKSSRSDGFFTIIQYKHTFIELHCCTEVTLSEKRLSNRVRSVIWSIKMQTVHGAVKGQKATSSLRAFAITLFHRSNMICF